MGKKKKKKKLEMVILKKGKVMIKGCDKLGYLVVRIDRETRQVTLKTNKESVAIKMLNGINGKTKIQVYKYTFRALRHMKLKPSN